MQHGHMSGHSIALNNTKYDTKQNKVEPKR